MTDQMTSTEAQTLIASAVAAGASHEDARAAALAAVCRYGAAGWSIALTPGARAEALAEARGSYQRALVEGREALSGSTLRGRAARYRGRYAASRDALLGRITSSEVRCLRGGARILVLG